MSDKFSFVKINQGNVLYRVMARSTDEAELALADYHQNPTDYIAVTIRPNLINITPKRSKADVMQQRYDRLARVLAAGEDLGGVRREDDAVHIPLSQKAIDSGEVYIADDGSVYVKAK